MKGIWTASLWVLAAVQAVPAAAQDTADPTVDVAVETDAQSEEAEAMAALAELFPAERLTAEQEARLPQARAIVEKIIPPGAMGEMMGAMFDGFLGPIMAMAEMTSSADAARLLGHEPEELDLSEDEAREVALLIDPALDERNARMKEALPRIMGGMMTAMEPGLKDAMSQIYAVYFDRSELADIDAFFSTPTGASYARKSLRMSSDPRLMSAFMTAMPEMFGSLAAMEEEMTALVADLPEQRSYADLDPAQRERLAALTGLSQEEIETGMEAARMADESDPEDIADTVEDDWAED